MVCHPRARKSRTTRSTSAAWRSSSRRSAAAPFQKAVSFAWPPTASNMARTRPTVTLAHRPASTSRTSTRGTPAAPASLAWVVPARFRMSRSSCPIRSSSFTELSLSRRTYLALIRLELHALLTSCAKCRCQRRRRRNLVESCAVRRWSIFTPAQDGPDSPSGVAISDKRRRTEANPQAPGYGGIRRRRRRAHPSGGHRDRSAPDRRRPRRWPRRTASRRCPLLLR